MVNILDKVRALESKIADALTRAAEDAVGSSAREPLEIAHAVVDAVERQVQAGSRGTRIFPFNRVAVSVLAPSAESRARLEALFAAAPSLQNRIVDRLTSLGCDAGGLRLDVSYVSKAAKRWSHSQFQVDFDRVAAETAAEVQADAKPRRIEVTVLRGAAERRGYSFTASRIDFGRGAEVRDHRQRLLRANHVAFVDGSDDVNQTVSRRHAHITIDPASGDHRLYDDASEQGTGIVRGGRTIPVPPGARGVRLRSGDEIVLGQARVRIRIDDPAASGVSSRTSS